MATRYSAWITITAALFSAVVCQGQNQPPDFQDFMDGLSLSENTAVDTSVYTLRGFDPEGASLTYGVLGDTFQVKNPATGVVSLRTALNYETGAALSVVTWVSDGVNLKVEKTATVTILDVNDASPVFTATSYSQSVPENLAVGSTIFTDITVEDLEPSNPQLSVTCVSPQNYPEACSVFTLAVAESTKNRWRGSLVLNRALNYENKQAYQVRLVATDGQGETQQNLDVTVTDIPDEPPSFTGSLSAIIAEDASVGTEVLQLQVTDGDTAAPRQVIFFIDSNPGNYFEVDDVSGWIVLRSRLDAPGTSSNNGFITIRVRASEVVVGNQIKPDATNTVSADVTISITDINNNGPVFWPNQYIVEMLEDTSNGMSLPDLQIRVTDADQGSNADFSLSLENFNNIFEIRPKQGTKSLTANIYMKDSSLIDYDGGQRKYVIHVIAAETHTVTPRRSDAYVTVNVQDVNDNKPVFAQKAYSAKIIETATGGTPVIAINATDKDSEYNGVKGIRYKLIGNGADKFKCNRITGQITVASCGIPGGSGCLDYESSRKFYSLVFVAGDQFGEGHLSEVGLNITLLDANDNSPRFQLPLYYSTITEGQTVPQPPVQVQATDRDGTTQYNQVTYNIVGGNSADLWQIDRKTGTVTATQGIKYEDTPGKRGYFLLSVLGSDGSKEATTRVNITVVDVNDNAPVFIPDSQYQETIPEDTPSGAYVLTVEANDQDSGLNGRVQYRIRTGAVDRFVINQTTGVINVAPNTVFDADVQNKYIMEVIAADQGSPQMSSTANVTIIILDTNNKKPFFSPSTYRAGIREDKKVGDPVITITAQDPDSTANLQYTFIEPIRAWTKTNTEISPNIHNNMFHINPNTGAVTINKALNYDQVALWSGIIQARDLNGSPDQVVTATLLITVVDVNERPPIFGPPWTPEKPEILLSLREEQAAGSYVTTLVASDDANAVNKYVISGDPGGNFAIDQLTGEITIKKPLDYETLTFTNFVVVAIDDGDPPLSATATINVNIKNINDNTPQFAQPEYRLTIPESAPDGYSVITLTGSDADRGDYGIMRFAMDDNTGRFTINSFTGLITVLNGSTFDRETEDTITLNVQAYDSPNDASVRRYTNALVIISFLDVNDNVPMFEVNPYYAVMVETAPEGASVIQVRAKDKDTGRNAELLYSEINGDSNDLFRVNRTTGLIITSQPLRHYDGKYNLTIRVQDNGNPSLRSNTTVYITVLAANNVPPRWVFPRPGNNTVFALEEQYQGMRVTRIQARDDDTGPNGEITYGFEVNDRFVNETTNFIINPFTGVITAKPGLDREKQDSYSLVVVARDSGNPPLSAKQRLLVQVGDINDHSPEFPMYRNCCSRAYSLAIQETQRNGTELGQIRAKDEDTGDNAKVIYRIINGNSDNVFHINSTSGQLYVVKPLDYDVTQFYSLVVHARNEFAVVPSSRANTSSCVPGCDAATVIVNINIISSVPDFGHSNFNTCIPMDAAVGSSVMKMVARSSVPGRSALMRYGMKYSENFHPSQANTPKAPAGSFKIAEVSGMVTTNIALQEYEDNYFQLSIEANDPGTRTGYAQLRVWVTPESKLVRIPYNRNKNYVDRNIEDIKRQISQKFNFGVVCVDRTVPLRPPNGGAADWTHIYMWVVDGDSLVILPPAHIIQVLNGTGLQAVAFIPTSAGWGGFDMLPILIAVILIILLLLLGLLFLCCWCCCGAIGGVKEKEKLEPMYLHTGTINPLWGGYESQELSMAVPGVVNGNKLLSSAAYTNAAYQADEVDANYSMSNGHVVSANDVRIDTMLGSSRSLLGTIPHIEAELEGNSLMGGVGGMGGGASTLGANSMMGNSAVYAGNMQNSSLQVGGSARIGSAGFMLGGDGGRHGSAGSVLGGGSRLGGSTLGASTHMLVSRGTMTGDDGGVGRSLSMSSSDVQSSRPSRIGATLTRPNAGISATHSHDAAYNNSAYRSRREQLNDDSNYTQTGYPAERRSVGIQAANSQSAYFDEPDHHTESSFNSNMFEVPVYGEEEGTYQGEIHLGTLPRSSRGSDGGHLDGTITNLNGGPGANLMPIGTVAGTQSNQQHWQHVEESRYSETRQYQDYDSDGDVFH